MEEGKSKEKQIKGKRHFGGAFYFVPGPGHSGTPMDIIKKQTGVVADCI